MSLTIQDLSFERHYQFLLEKIQCELHPGSLLHVIGENGSGKSTLLRLIAGYLSPTAGKILWKNTSIDNEECEYKNNIHYIGHHNGIKSQLTVLENIYLAIALSHYTVSKEEITAALKQLNLTHLQHTKALLLSAGQCRRVALTRLALSSATLWILDEPTNALDTNGQALFYQLVKKHLSQHGIVVMTSHQETVLTPTHTIQLGRKACETIL